MGLATLLVIASVAVPNFVNAMNRGKQKRTMADLRAIATSIEAYAVDHDVYPTADGSPELLRPYVVPTYIKEIPVLDGWGNPFRVRSGGQKYQVLSAGSDGVLPEKLPQGKTSSFEQEVIFENGSFVAYPEGVMT